MPGYYFRALSERNAGEMLGEKCWGYAYSSLYIAALGPVAGFRRYYCLNKGIFCFVAIVGPKCKQLGCGGASDRKGREILMINLIDNGFSPSYSSE
jgi:hypothetical protein